ncbi:MAG: hypothetical protein R3B57_12870 [Phycisphaerales bacterium]
MRVRRRRALGIAGGLGATLLAVVGVALIALVTPPRPVGALAPDRHHLHVYEHARWRPFDDGAPPPGSRVVLLVHGLDEPGDIWDDLTPVLADAGYTPIRFDYPNDQAVPRSGALLADALGALRDGRIEHLAIVAHSMGGLVTLDALTRDDAPTRPEVGRLITIGTPFAGSPWASLRWAGEVREQVQRLTEAGVEGVADLRRFLDDGEGEASLDLEPGSPFLTELLARPRPRGLEFTCIRGRLVAPGPGAPPDLRIIADTLGDGVVPIDSAVLTGVPDVVELRVNHRAMIRRLPFDPLSPSSQGGDPTPRAAPPPAIPVILERLRAGSEHTRPHPTTP